MSTRIVVTGGDGFIGRNLRFRLAELGYRDVVSIGRNASTDELQESLANADFVFHLAGVNRPPDAAEFEAGNAGFTREVCATIAANGRPVPIAFTSSTQAAADNPYGRSKQAAEDALRQYSQQSGAPAYVLRLTNVFGKWARPNYNSAVATFCYNLTRGLPITVNDPNASLNLLYIDDAITALVALIGAQTAGFQFTDAGPVYSTSVGEVATILRSFVDSRRSLIIPEVGQGLVRALYATYVSYLPPEEFSYGLTLHADPRGTFVEVIKTPAHGQVSFFTAGPGVTRGEHYHHTKTEKFLVVKGRARFAFRQIVTGELFDIVVNGEEPRVVETVPGWAHNITNIGDVELVVLLWANEIFDPKAPDTIASKVEPLP
jgi:UDP-2-acetamido-2,6-beta-L-arabino-hexul-4-ose reductase